MTFDFEERPGNLFDESASYSIAIGFSEDLRHGKGVPITMRQRYGNHQHHLQAQKHSVGQVAHVPLTPQRHAFYLVTRPKVYNRTNYTDLEACLIQLRRTCEQLGVRRLAVPSELGLDGVQDKYLKELIFKTFQGWQGRMLMFQQEDSRQL